MTSLKSRLWTTSFSMAISDRWLSRWSVIVVQSSLLTRPRTESDCSPEQFVAKSDRYRTPGAEAIWYKRRSKLTLSSHCWTPLVPQAKLQNCTIKFVWQIAFKIFRICFNQASGTFADRVWRQIEDFVQKPERISHYSITRPVVSWAHQSCCQ